MTSALWRPTARAAGEKLHIERLGSNQVVMHFDGLPNRTYTIQFINAFRTNGVRVTNSSTWGSWQKLAEFPSLPYPQHWVQGDSRNTKQRYYRLLIVPD